MTAAVMDDPATAQDDTEGLALHLVTRRSGQNAAAVTATSLTAGSEVLDTSGSAELWVAVANGATSGTSRKPLLCIGTPDEVAACREAISPTPPDAGVELPDAGADVPDAGQDAGEGGGSPAPSGCGCSGSGALSAGGWLGLLALLRTTRRSRREN